VLLILQVVLLVTVTVAIILYTLPADTALHSLLSETPSSRSAERQEECFQKLENPSSGESSL